MKIPPRNLPLDADGHARWLEEQAVKKIGEDAQRDRLIASIMKQLGMTAGSATDTNTQVETNRTDIIELKARAGIPPGGSPGDTITRDANQFATWTTVPYAVVPEYWIVLEEGAPAWSANRTLAEDNVPLPPVLFLDDGLTMEPIESGGAQAPVNLSVEVVPHFDDEEFVVSLPLVGGSGGGSPAYFTLSLYNSTAFRARVELGKQGHFSGGSALQYHGTQTFVYTPGEDTVRVLGPGEFVNWWVQLGGQDSFTGAVTPLSATSYVGDTVFGFSDAFYTKSVASMRNQMAWSASGALEVVSSDLPLPNGTGQVLVLGKVVVELGSAPVGADVLVDVKRNGVSIFTSPVVVTAGTTSGFKVPDVDTHTAAGVGVAGFDPGDRLTVDIVQVGSPGTEGADICVVVYFG